MKATSFAIALLMTIGTHAQVKSVNKGIPFVEQSAARQGITLPPRPWHMTNILYQFANPVTDFERYDVDIVIDRYIDESYNLYISPMNGSFNKMTFYGGLQTNINGWKSADDHTTVHPGKGAIFSRWSTTGDPIGLEYTQKADDGLFASDGNEGEFCSVRRPFKWTKGTYTMSIIKQETVDFDNMKQTWFAMTFTSKADNSVFEVGRLLFEGEKFTLSQTVVIFVEIYSTAKITNSDVPQAKITFSNPRINGIEPPLAGILSYYPTKGITASPICADVSLVNNDVEVTIGPEVRPEPEAKWKYLFDANGLR